MPLPHLCSGLVSEQDLKPYEEFKAKFKRPLQRHGFAEGIWEIEEDPQMTISTEGRAKRRGVPRKAPAQPKVSRGWGELGQRTLASSQVLPYKQVFDQDLTHF